MLTETPNVKYVEKHCGQLYFSYMAVSSFRAVPGQSRAVPGQSRAAPGSNQQDRVLLSGQLCCVASTLNYIVAPTKATMLFIIVSTTLSSIYEAIHCSRSLEHEEKKPHIDITAICTVVSMAVPTLLTILFTRCTTTLLTILFTRRTTTLLTILENVQQTFARKKHFIHALETQKILFFKYKITRKK